MYLFVPSDLYSRISELNLQNGFFRRRVENPAQGPFQHRDLRVDGCWRECVEIYYLRIVCHCHHLYLAAGEGEVQETLPAICSHLQHYLPDSQRGHQVILHRSRDFVSS